MKMDDMNMEKVFRINQYLGDESFCVNVIVWLLGDLYKATGSAQPG